MKYTAEQIKPKRYPDEKPETEGWYSAFPNTGGYWIEYFYTPSDISNQYPWDTRPIEWFIDIPNAPEDLNPLKYPENIPDEDGTYWVHYKYVDQWEIVKWHGDWVKYKDGNKVIIAGVDYFINYRLDQKEHEMNVIWETDELKVIKISKQPEEYLLTDDPKSIMRDVIKLSQNELTAFCLYWLELQGYDITEPELEIAPCPNPECGREVVLDSISVHDASHYKYFLSCKCGYESPLADSASEAIRLHNLIANK